MKIKLSKSQWELIGNKAGWTKIAEEEKYYQYPKPGLKKVKKVGNGYEVIFPVSYRYNGGTIIDNEWYKGYKVPPPDVPEGWELVDIGVGLQLNARPPYATMVLRPIEKISDKGE